MPSKHVLNSSHILTMNSLMVMTGISKLLNNVFCFIYIKNGRYTPDIPTNRIYMLIGSHIGSAVT